jgi:L-lactate dehydrogenase complex protein LldG
MVPAKPRGKMSREKILAAIRRNRPSETPLPNIPHFAAPAMALTQAFTLVAEAGGASVIKLGKKTLPDIVDLRFPGAKLIYSRVRSLASRGFSTEEIIPSPRALAPLDLAVLSGSLGVAENGAVWLSEAELGPRVSAFIAQHLLIELPACELVWNMHEAYARIDSTTLGFGVFIAGPSKTADIEQALVIGAQAARSLTIVLC